MRVFTVLRSGGEYHRGHVRALARMVRGPYSLFCLSDTPVWPISTIPLLHDWPGWWAKMELCHPDLRGPLLFIDLDTVLLGDLSPLAGDTTTSIAVRDFYRGRRDPDALQSSLMLLTEADRALVWGAWHHEGPEWWMNNVSSDQIVIERALKGRVRFWQDTHPGAVVGFKTDLHGGKMEPPPGTIAVVFHGKPRPWDAGPSWARSPWA